MRWVRRDKVRFLSENPILRKHKPAQLTLSKERFRARQLIEALRLGIVPDEYVEEFTFGRDEEIKLVKSWLDDPKEGSFIIKGGYGIGKTHLLEYVYSFALDNDWAVSIVEVEPNETPFSKPRNIYQRIISSFRFRSRNNDFRKFIKEIVSIIRDENSKKYCYHKGFRVKEYDQDGNLIYCPRDNVTIREGAGKCIGCKYHHTEYHRMGNLSPYEIVKHQYLGRIVKNLIDETGDDYVWEWIEGSFSLPHYTPMYEYLQPFGIRAQRRDKDYPPMYEYSTCANVYCYILSGIGWAAKNILDLNGFLILFDEAENIDPYWYTSYQNTKAWNFLKGLILMANNDKRLLEDNIEYDYSRQGYWGRNTDLQYCGYEKSLPFIWKIPCNVKIIFAFTPTPSLLESWPLNSIRNLWLEHLSDESLVKILKTIIRLYQKAYDFQIGVDYLDLILKNKINSFENETSLFVKRIVEILDLMRFYPNKPLEEILA